jgi:hypothetical protein
MSKLRLWTAVGLLAGHRNLRAHLYKLEHTERQECRMCGYEKEDSVHMVCDLRLLALSYIFMALFHVSYSLSTG